MTDVWSIYWSMLCRTFDILVAIPWYFLLWSIFLNTPVAALDLDKNTLQKDKYHLQFGEIQTHSSQSPQSLSQSSLLDPGGDWGLSRLMVLQGSPHFLWDYLGIFPKSVQWESDNQYSHCHHHQWKTTSDTFNDTTIMSTSTTTSVLKNTKGTWTRAGHA